MVSEPALIIADEKNRAPRGRLFSPQFRRLLKFLWPHRRKLMLGALASVLHAALNAAGLSAVLPISTILLEDEGLRGWIDRMLAEKRLDTHLETVAHALAENATLVETRVVIRRPGTNSPLRAAGVADHSEIVTLDGEKLDVQQWFARVATAPDAARLSLGVVHPGQADATTRTVQLRPAPWYAGAAARIERVLPMGNTRPDRIRTLAGVMLVLIALSILSNTFRFLSEYLVSTAILRALMDLRRHLYAKVLRLPMSFFTRQVGDLVSRFVQDINDVQRGLMALFGNLIREPLKAVAIVIWALWLDWRITLAMLLAGPIAMLIFWRVGESVRKANKKLLRGYGLMIGALSATLQTANVVKAYTAENAERRRFFSIDRKMLAQQKKLVRLDASLSPVLEVLATVAVCGLIIWLGGHVIGGSLDRSRFIALVITLAMMFDPLRKIADVYTRVQRSAAGAARLFDIFDAPEEAVGTDSRVELPPLREQIEFRNVSFAYPQDPTVNGVASGLVPGAARVDDTVASGLVPGAAGEGAPLTRGDATSAQAATPRWALERVNLTVRKGETVAIVGPNGSGKTTLMGMLLRFYDPDEGAILFDGIDIRRVNLRSLRQQISLVTQEAVIFADTIAANIAYGTRHVSREMIAQAARRAYAAEFIRLLPEEFDTIVGERGSTLSGGERQRLAIARAILRDAPILIFDEATSQVDSESEQKIQIALKEFAARRTTFIVAHRLSTIKFANRIIVMDAGRIVDSGTHEELLTRCPFYHGLCETQLVG